MRKILLLLILMVAGRDRLPAQERQYDAGGYSSLKELNAGTPSDHEIFTIFKRPSEEILIYGGNDYDIILRQDSGSYKKVWRRYYAIAQADTLFLNCKKLDVGLGFTPALVTGKYLAFKAYMPHSNTGNFQESIDGANPDKSKRQFPFLWALNTETGRTYMLTYGGMLRVLEPFPELTKAFMADDKKDQDETLLEYIRIANKQ